MNDTKADILAELHALETLLGSHAYRAYAAELQAWLGQADSALHSADPRDVATVAAAQARYVTLDGALRVLPEMVDTLRAKLKGE